MQEPNQIGKVPYSLGLAGYSVLYWEQKCTVVVRCEAPCYGFLNRECRIECLNKVALTPGLECNTLLELSSTICS